MKQAIHHVVVHTFGRGLFTATKPIRDWVAAQGIATGPLTVWGRHTSASLLVQANADAGVRADLEAFFIRLAPEGKGLYRHNEDNPGDMPAHLRAALTQVQVVVPVEEGRPVFGEFQDLYVFEHRSGLHKRELVLHLFGEA